MTIRTDSFDIDGGTDKGHQRKDNQDALSRPQNDLTSAQYTLRATYGRLAVVADGVGGHDKGDVASKLVIQKLQEHYYADTTTPVPTDAAGQGPFFAERLKQAVEATTADVFRQATAEGTNMASTVVAALIHGDAAHGAQQLTVANVGDSPAFLFRKGQEPRKLSQDHLHPPRRPGEKSALYQSMGDATVAVHISQEAFRKGDVVVLCTDGLTDLVKPDEIGAIVGRDSAAAATRRLINLANQRGGHDNITVLVVRHGKLPFLAQARTWMVGMRASALLLVLLLVGVALFGALGIDGSERPINSSGGDGPSLPFLGGDDPALQLDPTSELVTATPIPPTSTPAPIPTPQQTFPGITGPNREPAPVEPTSPLLRPTQPARNQGGNGNTSPPTPQPQRPQPTAPGQAPPPIPPTPVPPTPAPPTPVPPTPAPQLVTVPAVGAFEGEVYNILGAARLGVNVVRSGSGCNPYEVLRQEPAPGVQVQPGTVVTVYVCPPIYVPNVLGINKDAAAAQLSAAGLVPQFAPGYGDSDRTKNNLVQGTDPGPGSEVAPETMVTIYWWYHDAGGGGGGDRPPPRPGDRD